MSETMILYGYFRSSAAWRVRIALNLKSIVTELRFVHLRKDQQHEPDYLALNPQALIPAIVHDGHTIAQSLAILEYLDEVVPNPPLLPADAAAKAHVRRLAQMVACDIHPLNNLRVQGRLTEQFGAEDAAKLAWQQHWITLGFDALQQVLDQSPATGRFCHGDSPTIADICLIPQMANARRAEVDLSRWSTLLRIEEACAQIPAFIAARPENQPDAE